MAAARERRVTEFSGQANPESQDAFLFLDGTSGSILQASLELASPRLVRHAQLMALALFVGVPDGVKVASARMDPWVD